MKGWEIMKVSWLDVSKEYENTMTGVTLFLEDVKEYLDTHSQYILEKMACNGKEIFDDYYENLGENVEEIQEVIVYMKTICQISDEMMQEAQAYLQRAIPYIEQLADTFYNLPSEEDWGSLADMAEGLQWLHQFSDVVKRTGDTHYHNTEAYKDIDGKMKEVIEQINTALEASDTVTVADVIRYELVPLLVEFKMEIEKTLDHDIVRADLN